MITLGTHFRLLYASADLLILYLFGLTIKGHLWPCNTSALAPPSFRFHLCACVHKTLSYCLLTLVHVLPLCLCCCVRSQPSVRALVVLLSPSHLVCHPLPVSSVASHPFPSLCVLIKSRSNTDRPTDQPTDRPTDRLPDRPTDQPTNRIFRFWSCLFATLRTLSVRSLVGCSTAYSSLHTRTSSCLPALVGVFLGCVSHSEASLAYQYIVRAAQEAAGSRNAGRYTQEYSEWFC